MVKNPLFSYISTAGYLHLPHFLPQFLFLILKINMTIIKLPPPKTIFYHIHFSLFYISQNIFS